MDTKIILSEGLELQEKLIEIRHHLHANPEIGFDLHETYRYELGLEDEGT